MNDDSLKTHRNAASLSSLMCPMICCLAVLTACDLLWGQGDRGFLSAKTAAAQKQPPGNGKQPKGGKKQPGKKTPDKKPADDQPLEFPKYDEMIKNIPTVKELLQEDPVDWVVLNNKDVIVVKPVSPRPKTLEKIKQRIEESKNWPAPKTPEEREEQGKKRKELPYLHITLKDGGANPERRIHHRHIEQVIHHEDLLLKRIGLLQDEGNLALAFELLFKLKRRKPDWPGIDKYESRQLMVEAEQRLGEDRITAALVKLEELHSRNPQFPELDRLHGEATNRLVAPAVKEDDFRRARHYLGRLHRREPQHAVYKKWSAELQQQAEEFLSRARQAAQAGRHDAAARLVTEAANIWPQTPGLASAFQTMTTRFQRLDVGVRHLPGEFPAYVVPTLAEQRRRFLQQTDLFEPTGLEEVIHYRTPFFDEWIPTDLGRRTTFKLQADRPHWQPAPVVTGAALADNLRRRLDPHSPIYDERLTTYVQSFRVISPQQFELSFSRVPPRLESILRFPLYDSEARDTEGTPKNEATPKNEGTPGNDEGVGKTTAVAAPSFPLLTARFRPHEPSQWTSSRHVFRRNIPEPDNVPENRYHVAEIVEQRYDDPRRAVQALKRAEIDVLDHVRPFEQAALSEDNRIDVRRYALPVNHVLQFNPDSRMLQNREFRRALAYALNRRQMLDTHVLRTQDGGDSTLGRVVSAPYATSSYAYDDDVKPKQYDITLALALVLTIKRQAQQAHSAALGSSMVAGFSKRGDKHGWLPKLRMLLPPGDVPRRVAESCARQWGRIGIPVEVIHPEAVQKRSSPPWDILYRRVRMTDPLTDLWPFLTRDDRARVEGLKHLPDWLRQELIRVETARDWATAVNMMQRLHRHMAEETVLIPLFEVEDFMALRREVKAFRSLGVRPMHTYSNIERWTVTPRYPVQFP